MSRRIFILTSLVLAFILKALILFRKEARLLSWISDYLSTDSSTGVSTIGGNMGWFPFRIVGIIVCSLCLFIFIFPSRSLFLYLYLLILSFFLRHFEKIRIGHWDAKVPSSNEPFHKSLLLRFWFPKSPHYQRDDSCRARVWLSSAEWPWCPAASRFLPDISPSS